ncbi:MAG: transketolase C-terminal domain-containing protein [Bacteroidota bacterium]
MPNGGIMTYEEILAERALTDERLVVMTAENRAAIRNLPEKLGDRFIDVGIAEATMVGAAAGLALRGRIPVLHALATFLTLRAFEFIRTDIGIPNLPVKLVGGVPGLLSDGNGPTHQAIEDISLMRGIPNMKVFTPADAHELAAGIPAILDDASPWYIRFNATAPATDHHEPFAIGRAEIFGDGDDVAIITYGFMLREALVARDVLAAEGISSRVINLRTLKPIDVEAILAAADETILMVTVEDHFLSGGLYSIIGELFLKHRTMAPLLPIAFAERWFTPGRLEEVLVNEGLTGAQLAETIRRELISERTGSFHASRITSGMV